MQPPVKRYNTQFFKVECDQKWELMQPIESGRFCDSCVKPVYDFTGWERSQIRHFYKEHPTVCGLFKAEQLDKSLHPIEFSLRVRHLLIPFLALIGLPNLKAQDQAQNPINVEILPDTSKVKLKGKNIVVNKNTGAEISKPDKAYVVNPPVVKSSKEKKRDKKFYVSKRFPFIHRKRHVWMGCPVF